MLSPLEELMLTLNLHAHGRHAWTTYGLRGVYLRIANIPTARRQPRNNDKNVPTGHLMPLLVARRACPFPRRSLFPRSSRSLCLDLDFRTSPVRLHRSIEQRSERAIDRYLACPLGILSS